MKKTILLPLLLVSFFQLQLRAQANDVSLLLGKPTLGKGISNQYQTRLESQMLTLLTSGDGSANANFSVFSVQPALEILEQGKIEGMKSKPTVKLSLMLKLQNIYTNEVLEVQEATLTGVGSTADEAISKAISGIRKNQPQLGRALKEFQTAISGYYEKNCATILTNANDLGSRLQYRNAFALLQSVPQGTPCFNEVNEAKQVIYQQLQATECANNLTAAKAAKAANDFSKALHILSQVDAESPCFGEAKNMITDLETIVDEALKTQYEWMFKFYESGTAVETARWNAMNSLFLGWLRDSGKPIILNQ